MFRLLAPRLVLWPSALGWGGAPRYSFSGSLFVEQQFTDQVAPPQGVTLVSPLRATDPVPIEDRINLDRLALLVPMSGQDDQLLGSGGELVVLIRVVTSFRCP